MGRIPVQRGCLIGRVPARISTSRPLIMIFQVSLEDIKSSSIPRLAFDFIRRQKPVCAGRILRINHFPSICNYTSGIPSCCSLNDINSTRLCRIIDPTKGKSCKARTGGSPGTRHIIYADHHYDRMDATSHNIIYPWQMQLFAEDHR